MQFQVCSSYSVDRQFLFRDVIALYRRQEIVNECPIAIMFVDEIAVHRGGVQRDMYSGFWEKAYSLLFDGSILVTPMVHPQTDMSVLPILGRILSHGYLVAEFLPLRIALPTLTAMLLGPLTPIATNILLESFLDFISNVERTTFKSALLHVEDKAFPSNVQEELMTCLSRFGCRVVPAPSSLMVVIEQTARYEFITKPAAGIALINSGVPNCHRQFWNGKSQSDVQKLD